MPDNKNKISLEKDKAEFLLQQTSRSYYPLNNLKRFQVLNRQETRNLYNQLKRGATPEHVKSELQKLLDTFDKQASDLLKLELYLRSIKHSLKEINGEKVNTHE